MKTHQLKTDNFFLYWIIALCIACAFANCTPVKKTSSSSTTTTEENKTAEENTSWKQKYDALKITADEQVKELNSSLQFHEENTNGIISAFEDVQALFEEKNILSDSLNDRLHAIFDSLKNSPCKNKLIYRSDGTFEAFGLKSANLQLEQSNKKIELLTDQLETEINKRIKIEDDLKLVQSTKSTEKKRGIPIWLWSLWGIIVIIAFVCGFWLCWKYKDAIQEQLDSEGK